MHFTGRVKVQFKKSVLEPQGKAIELSLHENGYEGVNLIRVGKWIEIDVEANDEKSAREKVEEITQKVLYNPVMETAEIEIEAKAENS